MTARVSRVALAHARFPRHPPTQQQQTATGILILRRKGQATVQRDPRVSSMSRADSAAPSQPGAYASASTLVDELQRRISEWHLLFHGMHMAIQEMAHASALSIVKQPHPLGATTLSTQPYVVHKEADGERWRYLRIWPQVTTTLTLDMPSGPMQITLSPSNAPALPIPDGTRITAPGGNVNVTLELTDYAG